MLNTEQSINPSQNAIQLIEEALKVISTIENKINTVLLSTELCVDPGKSGQSGQSGQSELISRLNDLVEYLTSINNRINI